MEVTGGGSRTEVTSLRHLGGRGILSTMDAGVQSSAFRLPAHAARILPAFTGDYLSSGLGVICSR